MTTTRFKLPPRAAGVEISPPVPDAHRSDLQAVLAAQEAMVNGARAIARYNLEIFWQTMAALSPALWASAPPARTGIEALRRATIHLKDLGEIIHHANAEMLDVLNRRLTDALEAPATARRDPLRHPQPARN